MAITPTKVIRPFSLAILAMTFLCTLASTATAQRYEHLLPGNGNLAVGRWGVRPVAAGGYVAAGTITYANGTKDVYVARFNFNGTMVWSNTYDIGGANDDGNCIIECANGDFAITGQTTAFAPSNAFILRISAAGAILAGWPAIYSASFSGERIIETMPNPQGQRDLVFCGSAPTGAILARVSGVNGALFWNRSYSVNGNGGIFTDVIECQQGGVGDIAAVGDVGSGPNAIIRVNGNNGTIGLAPQGLGLIGNTIYHDDPVRLITLCEIQDGTNGLTGDLVAAGQTLRTFDVYVVRTGASPCTVKMDRTHGDVDPARTSVAYDIKEILPPAGSTSVLTRGNLILAGYSTERIPPPGIPNGDMLMLEIKPVNLNNLPTPTPVYYKVYDRAGRIDAAFSVHPVYRGAGGTPTDGYIMCGESFGPGVSDMYIIKTNNIGTTSCNNRPLNPVETRRFDTSGCYNVSFMSPLVRVTVPATSGTQTWPSTLCYTATKLGMPDAEAAIAEADAEAADAALTLASEPNPVRSGATLMLTCRSAGESFATITITDINGRLVRRVPQALAVGENRIEMSTDGWASGTYLVTVTAGERTRSEQVVVVE